MWFNICSGNGLLPDGTKPLPEPMWTLYQWGFVALTQDQFQRKVFKISTHKISLKNIFVKLLPHLWLAGANELTFSGDLCLVQHILNSKTIPTYPNHPSSLFQPRPALVSPWSSLPQLISPHCNTWTVWTRGVLRTERGLNRVTSYWRWESGNWVCIKSLGNSDGELLC